MPECLEIDKLRCETQATPSTSRAQRRAAQRASKKATRQYPAASAFAPGSESTKLPPCRPSFCLSQYSACRQSLLTRGQAGIFPSGLGYSAVF